MTTELTKAAQQALKPHQIAQLVNKLRDIAREFHAHDCLRELISREINSALTQRPTAQEVHPLASRCYAMSEPHLSGYRLVLGFETLEAVDAAHTWVANVRKAAQQVTPEPLTPDQQSALKQALFKSARIVEQATPEPVVHKCRHCGVTTIEDEDGVTMQGLPAPERPVMFDPSADVPIPATPEPLIVKGAMAGMVDAQVRDLWPTKGATPEPVGEPVAQVSDLFPSVRNKLHAQGFDSDAPLFTRSAPGSPSE